MLFENGTRHMQDINEIIDLLREKTNLVRPSPDLGGSKRALFYHTVAEAHDHVVCYMLEHRWHTEDLNRPCGELLRTPVLEAVRWGRKLLIELLIKRGADLSGRSSNPYKSEDEE